MHHSTLPSKHQISIVPLVITAVIALLFLVLVPPLHHRRNKPIAVPDNFELWDGEPEMNQSLRGVQSATGSVKYNQYTLPSSITRPSSARTRNTSTTRPDPSHPTIPVPTNQRVTPRLYGGGIGRSAYENFPESEQQDLQRHLNGQRAQYNYGSAAPHVSITPPSPRPESPVTAMIRAKEVKVAEQARIDAEKTRREEEHGLQQAEQQAEREEESKRAAERQKRHDELWARESERRQNPKPLGKGGSSILSGVTSDQSDTEEYRGRDIEQKSQRAHLMVHNIPSSLTLNSNTFTDHSPIPGETPDPNAVDLRGSTLAWDSKYRGSFVGKEDDTVVYSERLPGDAY
ncbi:hypothetical protein P280DRAFT_515348 [Massarina eburnea CBS 473.64]|uniref:Uncharacterized protein n=1 Tax=Massarina eburnea CBS 473.64 TaxID=1395130 RepID=A0A6A6S7C0_9PLEO|nr:hypothetical protein P280DRAFT_515348 [Massarina eburnea CBS 473.64]